MYLYTGSSKLKLNNELCMRHHLILWIFN